MIADAADVKLRACRIDCLSQAVDSMQPAVVLTLDATATFRLGEM